MEITAPPRTSAGRIGVVFWAALAYLVALLAMGLVYATPIASQLSLKIPSVVGPVPIGVPWFGALGAVLISLSGVFDHAHDWDDSKRYWHLSRPLIGASLSVVSVLAFQGGVLAINAQPPADAGVRNILYYLIAFIVGYREETFRDLIKRMGDVILTPGGAGGIPPLVREVRPVSGPTGGGTIVTISGTGFTGTTEVRFGQKTVRFTVDTDGQITTASPVADVLGPVPVTVTTKQGTATGAVFTYR